ncbi:hypothetical protein [Luteolibacter marinus]|uniref:hypothetical protein n=1 Tax=Luteolibacter marinus TaxID=2776705 RepID=UPI001865FABE|nr:hypothetical protein [Luteolibacter marinus]
MSRDLEEIYAKGCWWFPRRVAFYLSAVWVGSQVGAFAIAAGFLTAMRRFHPDQFKVIWQSPLLLDGEWDVLNALVLASAAVWFARLDTLGYRSWAAFAGIESVFAVLGGIYDVQGPLAVTVTWFVWLVLAIAMATAVWFFRQWQLNRWAAEITMLKAENAARRAARPNDAGAEEPLDPC